MDEFLRLPLVNLAAGAFVTYLFAIRRSRREEIDRLFGEAMASVVGLQASRHIGSGIPQELLQGTTKQHEDLKLEIASESIKAFIQAARETRLKLAAVYPYCPEVRPYCERFEIPEYEVDELLDMLRAGRRKHGRLFRFRRPMT